MPTQRKPLKPCDKGCGAMVTAGKRYCKPCASEDIDERKHARDKARDAVRKLTISSAYGKFHK